MIESEPRQKTKSVNGSDNVSPYNTEIGLNNGAVSPNAMIVPPEIPLRRICTMMGITPNEHTGSSIPSSQA
jgi:hypothetical protein